MIMDHLTLLADSTVEEYELIDPPKENHLREDQMNRLLFDSWVHAVKTLPILRSRKEMTDEEFETEKQRVHDLFEEFLPYLFTAFLSEHTRLYNVYCWRCYKEKKKAMIEPSYFEKIALDWSLYVLEQQEEKEKEKETSDNQADSSAETPSEEETSWLHVFDEKQMQLRLTLYEESIYARHTEYHYAEYGELPDPDLIREQTKEKVDFELRVIKQFIAIGQQCKELDVRRVLDDCFFSFEDDKFLFFYGKSIYKFTVSDGDFYLKENKVDLPAFFSNLRQENKRVWKHAIRLGKLFERKGIPYCTNGTENLFFLHRIVDEQDTFYLRYKQAEMTVLWDKRNFYRMNGEQIKVPSILVHEMVELNGSRKKAQLKAKQYFQMFLTKAEKEMFVKTKSVFVKGETYDYLFCPEILVNSIIRMDKNTGKKESMCVMLDDPYIPRYDVIASALLMVKTGQENQLNAIANAFECSDAHHQMLKKHGQLQ